MEASTIASARRTTSGKGSSRRIRATGQIPAVVYGHGLEDPIAVVVDPRPLLKALEGPKGYNALFELQIEGEASHHVLVRALQRDPVSRSLLHVDFVAPNLEKTVVAEVPLHTTGRAVGVELGGHLHMPNRTVKLSALPEHIPAAVTVDVTPLEEGDSIMASEIALPDGVQTVFDRDYVVAKVVVPRGQIEELEEEEGEGEGEGEGEEAEGEDAAATEETAG